MAVAYKKKNVTMTSIAKEVGVSRSAVSYVLNGRTREKQLSKDTAKKIMETAKKLGYVPNRWAQGLVKQRSGLISVLLSSLSYDWSERLVRGAMSVFDKNDYSTFLALHLREKGRENKDILSVIERCDEGVLCSPFPDGSEDYRILLNRGVPLVFLDDTLSDLPEVSFVAWDSETATRKAMDYLIKKGRRKIGFIGPKFSSWSTQKRFQTYTKVLHENKLFVKDEWIGLEEAGLPANKVVKDMFSQEYELPDALFVSDDPLGLQTIDQLGRMGIRMPDDVAVISLGDLEGTSNFWTGLTTVHEPVEEIGRQAAEVMLELIKDPSKAPIRRIVKEAELVIRKTA